MLAAFVVLARLMDRASARSDVGGLERGGTAAVLRDRWQTGLGSQIQLGRSFFELMRSPNPLSSQKLLYLSA